MAQEVAWQLTGNEWRLMWGRRSVASVWVTGTWHTWDRVGVGGENASEPTIERAKRETLDALVRQNIQPYKGWARHSVRCARAIERECAHHHAIEAGRVSYEEGRVLKAAEAWKAGETWATQRLIDAVEAMRARRLEAPCAT
jgi:hypothetical protein